MSLKYEPASVLCPPAQEPGAALGFYHTIPGIKLHVSVMKRILMMMHNILALRLAAGVQAVTRLTTCWLVTRL